MEIESSFNEYENKQKSYLTVDAPSAILEREQKVIPHPKKKKRKQRRKTPTHPFIHSSIHPSNQSIKQANKKQYDTEYEVHAHGGVRLQTQTRT